MVRGSHSDERLDVDARMLQARDHVAGVEPAHTVGDDVDALALCLGNDVLGELGGALLNRAAWWHLGGDDLAVVGGQGLLDATPVLDTGQIRARKPQLSKTQ